MYEQQLTSVDQLIKQAGVMGLLQKGYQKVRGAGRMIKEHPQALSLAGTGSLLSAPNPATGRFGLEGILKRYTPEQKAMYQKNAQDIQARMERLARMRGITTQRSLTGIEPVDETLLTPFTSYNPAKQKILGSNFMLSNPMIYGHELGHGIDMGNKQGLASKIGRIIPQIAPLVANAAPAKYNNAIRGIAAAGGGKNLQEEVYADYIANNMLKRLEKKVGPTGISRGPFWARQLLGGYTAPLVGSDMTMANMVAKKAGPTRSNPVLSMMDDTLLQGR